MLKNANIALATVGLDRGLASEHKRSAGIRLLYSTSFLETSTEHNLSKVYTSNVNI